MGVKMYPKQADVVSMQNDLRDLFERGGYKTEMGVDPVGPTLTVSAVKHVWNMPFWLGAIAGLKLKIALTPSGTTVDFSGQKYLVHHVVIVAEYILLNLIINLLFGDVYSYYGGITIEVLLSCIPYVFLIIPIFAAFEQFQINRRVHDMVDYHFSRAAFG
jgi:hypothetical protein